MATLEELKAELSRREAATPVIKIKDQPVEVLKAELAERNRGNLNILPETIPFTDVKIPTLKEAGKSVVETLPTAGAVIGGGLGFASPLPGGMMIGAGAGGVMGEGLKQQAQSMFFPEDAPKTRTEAFTRQARSGLMEAAGEGGGRIAGEILSKGARSIFPAAKKGAQETIAAAKRLGVKPTKGQITESDMVQGLESSLEQSPTLTGSFARRTRSKIENAISKRLEKAIPAAEGGLTKFETGESVKKSIAKPIAEKLAKARSLYKSVEDKFSDQLVSPNLLDKVTGRLRLTKAMRLQPNSPAGRLAKELGESIKNIRTVQDLKDFRTLVGDRYKIDMDDATREVVDEIYDSLTEIRGQSLIFDKESAAIIKEADSLWKTLKNEIKIVDDTFGGRKSNGPEQFLKKLDKFEGSKVSQKLLRANEVGGLKALKESNPAEFKILRDERVNDILTSSEVKGTLNSRKLVKNIAKLPEETQVLFFGDEAVSLLKDVKTLTDAFPNMIGPSGTPRGIRFEGGIFRTILNNATDLFRLAVKKGIPSGMSEAERVGVERALNNIGQLAGKGPADLSQRKKSKPIERRLRGK